MLVQCVIYTLTVLEILLRRCLPIVQLVSDRPHVRTQRHTVMHVVACGRQTIGPIVLWSNPIIARALKLKSLSIRVDWCTRFGGTTNFVHRRELQFLTVEFVRFLPACPFMLVSRYLFRQVNAMRLFLLHSARRTVFIALPRPTRDQMHAHVEALCAASVDPTG